jgi:hypothetical protein
MEYWMHFDIGFTFNLFMFLNTYSTIGNGAPPLDMDFGYGLKA